MSNSTAATNGTSSAGAVLTNGEPAMLVEAPPVLLKDIDTDFLSLIYDIIRSLEKETSNEPMVKVLGGGQHQASLDIQYKMQQLKERFDTFRTDIEKVAGIDQDKSDQLQQLASLREQLIMKKELLMKYKQNDIFSSLATTLGNVKDAMQGTSQSCSSGQHTSQTNS